MSYIEFPLQFRRQYAGALDDGLVFNTYSTLTDYIQNSNLAYAGQVVAVTDTNSLYVINNTVDGTVLVNTGTTISEALDSVFNTVQSTSGDWNSAYSNVNANSAAWGIDTVYDDSLLQSTSGDWNSAYSELTNIGLAGNNITNADVISANTIHSISAFTHYQDILVSELSGFSVEGDVSVTGQVDVSGTLSANNIVYALDGDSAQWNSNYSNVNANSANWGNDTVYDDSLLQATSGDWNSNYSVVNANSASWGGVGSGDFCSTTVLLNEVSACGGTMSVDGLLSASDMTTTTLTADGIYFNTGADRPPELGELVWDEAEKTLDLGLENGVVLQVGEEQLINVQASEEIKDGQVVYASGAFSQGNTSRIVVSLYSASSAEGIDIGATDELFFLGVATQDIAQDTSGYITTFGKVRNINVYDGNNVNSDIVGPDNVGGAGNDPDWPVGKTLYVSTSAGRLTNTPPESPNKTIPTAMVISQSGNGHQRTLFVRQEHGYHIDELHDVRVINPQQNDVLAYNSTLESWDNVTSNNWESAFTTMGTNSANWDNTANTLDSVTTNGATTTNDITVGSKFATGDNTASGDNSIAIGGAGNSAIGDNSEVLGGGGSTASGTGSTIVGGNNNTNRANWTAVVGGLNHDVLSGAVRGGILGGYDHHLNHADSVILGGNNITTDAINTVFVPNLNVKDGFKMPTGATAGYVLKTDGNGVGSWQEVAQPVGGASWVYNSSGSSDQIHGDIPNGWRNISANTADQLVVIGTSCTSIGSMAFVGHNNADGGLVIPDSVTSMGTFAFQSYAASGTIKGNLYLSKNLTRIEMGVFQLAKFIGELILPAGLTYIGSNGFSNGTFTGDLTIPPLVTELGNNSFYSCASLGSKLTLPESLATIGSQSFRNCTGITTIDCFTTKTALDVTDSLLGSGVTTIHARATDSTWTAGSGQTIGSKTGITVIKDL